MTTLTVWAFADADTVYRAERDLGMLAARHSLGVEDGAVLTWPANRSRPRTRQLQSIALTAAVGDAFWGILFGTVFFIPTLGLLANSDVATLSSALRGIGIDENFINELRRVLSPSTSALFVLSGTDTADLAGMAGGRNCHG